MTEIAAEMEDRFGPPPEEARRLVKLMTPQDGAAPAARARLRGERARRDAASARRHAARPREDHRARSAGPRGAWKLTPDMRLSRRFGGAGDAVANAETALAELVNLER